MQVTRFTLHALHTDAKTNARSNEKRVKDVDNGLDNVRWVQAPYVDLWLPRKNFCGELQLVRV